MLCLLLLLLVLLLLSFVWHMLPSSVQLLLGQLIVSKHSLTARLAFCSGGDVACCAFLCLCTGLGACHGQQPGN